MVIAISGAPVFAGGRTGELVDLITDADAIVAVEILRTDYTATANDGPMYGDAKILKVIKGRLARESTLRFGDSAWCVPTQGAGERRILPLKRVNSTEYYSSARWAVPCSVSSRIDLLLPLDSIEALSLTSFETFLKEIQEARRTPPKIEIQVTQRQGSALVLSIKLINASNLPLWLNPSRVTVSFDAGNVRYSPEIGFADNAREAWKNIAPTSSITGTMRIPSEAVEGTKQTIFWVSHWSAYFPKRCWTGVVQSGPVPLGN